LAEENLGTILEVVVGKAASWCTFLCWRWWWTYRRRIGHGDLCGHRGVCWVIGCCCCSLHTVGCWILEVDTTFFPSSENFLRTCFRQGKQGDEKVSPDRRGHDLKSP
jgi:hypothetical protein